MSPVRLQQIRELYDGLRTRKPVYRWETRTALQRASFGLSKNSDASISNLQLSCAKKKICLWPGRSAPICYNWTEGNIWDLCSYLEVSRRTDKRTDGRTRPMLNAAIHYTDAEECVYHRSDGARAVYRKWRLARSTDRRPRQRLKRCSHCARHRATPTRHGNLHVKVAGRHRTTSSGVVVSSGVVRCRAQCEHSFSQPCL